jgi:hypothetical protein
MSKISEYQIEQIIEKHSILCAGEQMVWNRRDMILAIKEIRELIDKKGGLRDEIQSGN